MSYWEAGRALGVHPNSLRYAAATGRVLIRWEGARWPTAWILSRDEPTLRAGSGPVAVAPARLLPSGDAYLLAQGADRELLVPAASLPLPGLQGRIVIRWDN
jgi:hypothetical protein